MGASSYFDFKSRLEESVANDAIRTGAGTQMPSPVCGRATDLMPQRVINTSLGTLICRPLLPAQCWLGKAPLES